MCIRDSKVFLLNKVNLILSTSYIASVAIFLFASKSLPLSLIELIEIIAMISLCFAVLRAAVNLRLMRKLTKLNLTYRNLIHYIAASAVMAAVIYLLRMRMPPLPTRAVEAAPPIIILVALGAIIYGAILYATSQEFRNFLKEVRIFILGK